jgi:acyl-CoA thioester hydrolase
MAEIVRASATCEISPDHIDLFNHLRWAYYPYYFDQGREKLQERLGIADQDLKNEGCGLLVTGMSDVRYRIQIPPGETIEVVSFLDSYEGIRMGMHHEIFNGDRNLATRCNTAHTFVNLGDGKPINLHHAPEIVEKFIALLKTNQY